MRHKNSGAALVLVLMIVALMSVLVMMAVNNNRMLVREAKLLKQRDIALTNIDDIKIDLITLLTTTPLWLLGANHPLMAEESLPKGMNFFGEPFEYNDATVRIQDLSGLISLYPLDDKSLKALILHKGYSAAQANTVIDSVADWIDQDSFVRLNGAESHYYSSLGSPRNAALQSLDELILIKGFTLELWQDIKPYITLFSAGVLNKANAPSSLVPVFFSEYRTEQVVKARIKAIATGDESVLEIDDQELLYPGRKLRIGIDIEFEGTVYRKSFSLIRTRGVTEPFLIADTVVGDYE